jgi:N-acetylmuramoyl-L-alanine amidase
VIVIDPAHGGTDTGARGQNGVIEKDIVLQFARVTRGELVRQGYRVVLTRDDDSNPSYDDRAAMANSYRDAIFVSLHISSTGTQGIAHAYYYQFWKPLPPAAQSGSYGDDKSQDPAFLSTPPPTLMPWNEAQRGYADASQRLADQLQAQLAALFSGSPQASAGVELRGLRSVAAPAADIEVSSVSVKDAKLLTMTAGPLAASIAKGIQAFRTANSVGAK